MWKYCANTSVLLCELNVIIRAKLSLIFNQNAKNPTYSPTFSHHSTTFPTTLLYLYLLNLFHFYTVPTNTTTIII